MRREQERSAARSGADGARTSSGQLGGEDNALELELQRTASAERFERFFDALTERQACHAIAAEIFNVEMCDAERAVARRYVGEFLRLPEREGDA